MRDPRRECFPFGRERCWPGRRPFVDLQRRQVLSASRYHADERESASDRCARVLLRFAGDEAEALLAELLEFFESSAELCIWLRQTTGDGSAHRGVLIDKKDWKALRRDFVAYQERQTPWNEEWRQS